MKNISSVKTWRDKKKSNQKNGNAKAKEHVIKNYKKCFKSAGPMPKDLVAKGMPMQKKGFLTQMVGMNSQLSSSHIFFQISSCSMRFSRSFSMGK